MTATRTPRVQRADREDDDRLPDVLPPVRPDVMTADFDVELVVLVPDQRRVHHLDEGLSIVLDSCDGRTPTATLVDEVADATGVGPSGVERWLADAIRRLDDLELLVRPADAAVDPAIADDPERGVR